MIGYRRIFVDTAPFIYFLEESDAYLDKIETFFDDCRKSDVSLITSVITVEEYLVHPVATHNKILVDNFKEFLDFMDVHVAWINNGIAEKAAYIRAEHSSFKAMDALQIATALQCGCDAFFTNDKQLRQEQYIPCITMDDLPF